MKSTLSTVRKYKLTAEEVSKAVQYYLVNSKDALLGDEVVCTHQCNSDGRTSEYSGMTVEAWYEQLV